MTECLDCDAAWATGTSSLAWCPVCSSTNIKMIQSHIEKDPAITTKSYLVIVEQTPNVDDDDITQALAGALTWLEGVGEADVVSMGDYTSPEGDA